MRDSVTTSWRRLSDPLRHADTVGTPYPEAPLPESKEARHLEAWESEGANAASSPGQARILIVDSDIKSSQSLDLLLQAAGCSQTCVAYSGHAAIAIAEDFQPTLVLVDLNLLDMNGYELARLLRGNSPKRELRLIAMTSSREPATPQLPRGRGFERYLYKPIIGLDFLSANVSPF
jgi:CheY-like chemotaxis protein